jgi:mevalonate kinase
MGVFAEISRLVEAFSAAIEYEQYDQAGRLLLVESELRAQLIPQVLPEENEILLRVAQEAGCGAKVTGRGEGGCIWAIGSEESIGEVRLGWQDIFDRRGSGILLPTSIAAKGLKVTLK